MSTKNLLLRLHIFIAMFIAAINMTANVTDSLGYNPSVFSNPDSLTPQKKLASQAVDSLTNENLVLKSLLKESQKETELKESDILKLKKELEGIQNGTVKRLEASNDSLRRKLISMASNFLYIPYDQYSIEEIAIPAFKASAGSSVYVQYQNRLPLFENYNSYILSLIEFLAKAENDTSSSFKLTSMRKNNANEALTVLSTLPVFNDYMRYEDWKNTFLGKQIVAIQRILNSPNDSTSSQLKEIRIRLEGLLNN